MEPEITPEQKDKLTTWAGERDAILLEISNLELDREQIKKENVGLTDSYTDIHNRMKVIQGGIEELKIKEAELPLLISKDVANLESKKTSLESEITNLAKIVTILTEQKRSLEQDVDFALATFSAVKDRTLFLDKIVDRVTQVSENNKKKIDDIVTDLGTSLEEIIKVNKKNVEETNVVIEKVPAMLIELQKNKLISHRQDIIRHN